MDIDQQITQAFQASQLILVFVIVLFNIFYLEIQRYIHKTIPLDENDHEEYYKYLNDTLKPFCKLLIILFVILFILFLPLTLEIIIQSLILITHENINNWDFNFIRTSYVIIALLILLFVYLTIKLFNNLKKRIEHVKKKLDKKKEIS